MFDVDSAASASAAPVPTSLPLGPGGRLYPEAISGIVRIHFGALLACYYAGLKKDPKLAGTVTVQYLFGEDGVPKEVADDVRILYPLQFAPGDFVTRQPAPLRPL